MKRQVLVLLAEGFEEVEALTPVDYLRRVDIAVTTVGVTGQEPCGVHGIPVRADITLHDLIADARRSQPDAWDAILIPGGMPGAINIAASAECGDLIRALFRAGKLVGAICAAPAVVLSPLGVLEGKRYTCFPGMEAKLPSGHWVGDRVVRDGKLVTSRAAGTAAEWTLAIVAALVGEDVARELAERLLLAGA